MVTSGIWTHSLTTQSNALNIWPWHPTTQTYPNCIKIAFVWPGLICQPHQCMIGIQCFLFEQLYILSHGHGQSTFSTVHNTGQMLIARTTARSTSWICTQWTGSDIPSDSSGLLTGFRRLVCLFVLSQDKKNSFKDLLFYLLCSVRP